MKRLVVVVFALIGVMFLYGPVQADLNDGLVAYYPFNGNANDESGNGNNGTVDGATLTTDRFGNADSAYSFDGVDDHITVSNSASLNTSIFTIACWVKVNSTPSSFLDKRNGGGNHNYQILLSGGNELIAYIGDGTNYSTQGISLDLNKLYHIATTYDQSELVVYVNGEKSSTLNVSTSGNVGDGDLIIGFDGSSDYPMDGDIDELRIYNRVLSETEIKRVYWGGSEMTDSTTCGSTGDSITLNADLSFTVPDMIYQGVFGTMNLETNFTFFGDQNGDLLWKLDSYTAK
ncbi:MAG: LamG domain-containing protein [Proteobacteria bacterium]|nr:LamG domain-containing protein [Pseudomonadota bacterium]